MLCLLEIFFGLEGRYDNVISVGSHVEGSAKIVSVVLRWIQCVESNDTFLRIFESADGETKIKLGSNDILT